MPFDLCRQTIVGSSMLGSRLCFQALPHSLVCVAFATMLCSVAAVEPPSECLREGSTPEANASTLRAITYGLDRFVAVGDKGTILVSTNCVNWVRQSAVTSLG